MILTFPSSPAVGDYHTYNSRVWRWNGTVWELVQPVQFAKVGSYVETITPNREGHARLLAGPVPVIVALLLSAVCAFGQAPTVSKVMVDVKMSDGKFQERELTPVNNYVIGFDGSGQLVVKADGGGGGGSIGGSTGANDSRILLADGTGGSTIKASSAWLIDGATLQGAGGNVDLVFPSAASGEVLGVNLSRNQLQWTISDGNVLNPVVALKPNLTTPASINVTLPSASGTLALLSDITGTNSGTNTGDVTLTGTPDYITISGQVITLHGIDLATDITGTLPIANGGTGQTTQTAAFDALAPTTTKGDIIVHNGTDNVRVPVGTDGHALVADSTQASGVKWAAGGGGSGKVAQVVYTEDSTAKTSTVTIPLDDTIPQSSEGTAYAELDTTITPTNASSVLLVEVMIPAYTSAINSPIAALFKDSETDALSVAYTTLHASGYAGLLILRHRITAGTTSAQTFKVRFGRNSGAVTIYLNDWTSPYFGGALKSTMTITEILP